MRNKNIYDIKELGFVPPRYGGVSVSIARLINRLTADGFTVGGFYTNENKDPKILNSPLFDYQWGLSTRRLMTSLFHYLPILRKYKLLHSHYSLHFMLFIWVFLTFLKKKIVITVHDSMIRVFYETGDDFVNKFFLRIVAKNKTITWIAVSEQVKSELQKFPFPFLGQIHVIPAYIPDTEGMSKPLRPDIKKYVESHSKTIVFYAHSFMLHQGKDVYGIEDALMVYKRIVNDNSFSVGLVFCLAENKDFEKIRQLHDFSNSLGVDDLVFWQEGPIDSMYSLWRLTDVYIRPTYTDGDAVAIREALDMGAQVVASDVCSRPSRCLLYQYGDTEDLYNKIKKAISLGRNKEQLNFENYNKIKAIYQDLL